MAFRYPENLRFTCTRCGLCCGDTPTKTRHILLLPSDVRRISQSTKQPLNSFAHRITGKTPYLYEMHKQNSGKCLFLKENQCSIYQNRPLICRFYPFELKTDENQTPVFTATNECPSISSADPMQETVLDAKYFERLLALARAELSCSCE
ncbi:MAG: YkgJ family cysteine cluster protein [Candidatus Bathyarchaeota archaeon]|nr:YkgJ family cysteine cluster protein [Candidatus Bathyarchaeota archaeon]